MAKGGICQITCLWSKLLDIIVFTCTDATLALITVHQVHVDVADVTIRMNSHQAGQF